jgi:NADH-quinone oxidoreductase subunit L
MIGVFVTAFYSFRLLFMTFHGKPRWAEQGAHDAHADPHAVTHPVVHAKDDHAHDHSHDDHGAHDDHGHHGGTPHESPAVVTVPLLALAIPSIFIGAMTFKWMLFDGGFGGAIYFSDANREALQEIGVQMGDWLHMGLHAIQNPVFYIMALGVFAAWALYIKWPDIPGKIDAKLQLLRKLLENKYFFDWFNENVIARGSRLLGTGLWKAGDQFLIDGVAVNGSANTVGFIAGIVRRVQSGFLYSYAFWMVIGLAVMLGWFLMRLI